MTDKCEYEPVDTGEGKKKVRDNVSNLPLLDSCVCRLRKWRKRQLVWKPLLGWYKDAQSLLDPSLVLESSLLQEECWNRQEVSTCHWQSGFCQDSTPWLEPIAMLNLAFLLEKYKPNNPHKIKMTFVFLAWRWLHLHFGLIGSFHWFCQIVGRMPDCKTLHHHHCSSHICQVQCQTHLPRMWTSRWECSYACCCLYL